MPDIVITEFMDEDAILRGLEGFDVLYDPKLVDRAEDLERAVADARALIVRNRTQVRLQLLKAAAKLRAVGRLGVGLDNIDVDACRARQVAVFPATGANDVPVAEYVIGTAMVLLRGAYAATEEVIAGAWPRSRLMGREIAGKRLGLVGFGAIAKETASRAVALGMNVSAHDPYVQGDSPVWDQAWGRVEPASLTDLLATSDVVSLHVPLTVETRNLIGPKEIAWMNPSAILINAARGGVVDEAAVADALRAGRLGGAALDVFDEEPLPAARGGLFSGCPNLILTPHIAGLTAESNVRVSRMIADAIRCHLEVGTGKGRGRPTSGTM